MHRSARGMDSQYLDWDTVGDLGSPRQKAEPFRGKGKGKGKSDKGRTPPWQQQQSRERSSRRGDDSWTSGSQSSWRDRNSWNASSERPDWSDDSWESKPNRGYYTGGSWNQSSSAGTWNQGSGSSWQGQNYDNDWESKRGTLGTTSTPPRKPEGKTTGALRGDATIVQAHKGVLCLISTTSEGRASAK